MTLNVYVFNIRKSSSNLDRINSDFMSEIEACFDNF